MNKSILFATVLLLTFQNVYAEGIFDSMDRATEVKLVPAIKTAQTQQQQPAAAATINAVNVSNASPIPTYRATTKSIKEEKFNTALVNLDDAQVELREELAAITAKYNVALDEKAKATENCKTLKKEIKDINTKMRNVDKSKKMINKNLDVVK